MVKEPAPETVSPAGWVQDEIYNLKAQISGLEQQIDHVQSASSQLAEQLRTIEDALRRALQGASQTPRLQEELNQTVALVVQLQDQQAESKQQLELLGRQRNVEETKDQEDWVDVARRTDAVERRVELWEDRQAGVDEVGRRFQESVSLIRQQLQEIEKRLENAESKGARGLEGANRAEHTITQVEAAVLQLQREDEALAERVRANTDAAHRLETLINEHVSELQRMELLAERIELHRAERQRLEDRAMRLEEEFGELRTRLERNEQQYGRLTTQHAGLGSRVDALNEQLNEQRTLILDKLRKMTASQERTRRSQIQQLERELREMRQYVADLAEP